VRKKKNGRIAKKKKEVEEKEEEEQQQEEKEVVKKGLHTKQIFQSFRTFFSTNKLFIFQIRQLQSTEPVATE
jgi:hypothetical protein